MATYRRYSDEDLAKAIKAVESGHTYQWAGMRYGVPKDTVRNKHKQFKQEKQHE